MKQLLLAVICLFGPLQLDAGAQSGQWRIAYDVCSPYIGDYGYETWCSINVQGSDSVVMSPMYGVEPVWSSDGTRVAVADGNIYTYSFADRTYATLPTGSAYGSPRWSPDNTRVAFVSYRDDAPELYVMNADGTAQTRLTQNAGFTGPFEWSPNSTSIAFAATVDGGRELFVMNADGSNRTRLTYNVGFDAQVWRRAPSSPSWSPDGARIAFDCVDDICTINADGSGFTRLTNEPGGSYGALFSPVDGRIALLTARFGGLDLVVMTGDGAMTRVAPGHWAAQHAWSPDGGSLAFVSVVQGYVCPADGSCIDGQFDIIYIAKSDGTGLAELGSGHHPRWAPSVGGQLVATFAYECAGTACEFDASDSFDTDGNVASYVWNFGDGTSASGALAAHTYATGTSYDVMLTVTDNSGQTAVSRRRVSANTPPVASLTVACNGPTCTFDASASSDPDGAINAYSWNFGDGSILQTFEPTVTHLYPNGTFAMIVYVWDNGGGYVIERRTITVVNPLPVASFTASCTDLTCTFDASASTDDSPLEYIWSFGTGWGVGKIQSFTYHRWGTYLVTLRVRDAAGQETIASKTISVGSEPPPEQMHVGDLDFSKWSTPRLWSVSVMIVLHRADHTPLGGVNLAGTWDDGTSWSCVTYTDGKCWAGKNDIPRKTNSVTLRVTSAVHYAFVYAPSANHDPDGDSDGTVIRIARQ